MKMIFFFSAQHPEEGGKPTKWEDLQGFWEMVKIQVDDVDEMFTEIELLRQNGWTEIKALVRLPYFLRIAAFCFIFDL